MKSTHLITASAIIGAVALALTGCATNESSTGATTSGSSLSGTLTGIGASSQGSAQDAWITAFQTANSGVTVSYSPDGSGAGRKAFIAGGANFAGSDSALSSDELSSTFAACAAGTSPIEVPAYVSPIAVVFNVSGVTALNLDAETLAKIFSGAITKWNDPAIVALNPDAKLPDATITAVHRSDDSGTTKNFTDYLNQVAPSAWADEAADTFPAAAGGEGAKGTSGVIDAVTNGTNTIGYADASKAGSLGVAKIKVGDTYVAPSADGAAAVVNDSPLVEGRSSSDIAITINRTTTDSTHYPLVLVSYLIGCQQYTDSATGTLVKAYFSYVTSAEGQSAAATAAGSAPLSSELSAKVAAVVATIK